MKAQNVLGQFEDAKSLVNTPSAVGVILMPLTPAVVPKDPPLLVTTANHVDSAGRPSSVKSFPSVQPGVAGKASEGNFFVTRCSSDIKLLKTGQKPFTITTEMQYRFL